MIPKTQVHMWGDLIVQQAERQTLARRMLEFYRTSEVYFDDVKEVVGTRPSQEELVLFEALVKLRPIRASELRVLELGCGRCESAPKLMDMLGGGSFSGIEASPAAVQHAQGQSPAFDLRTGDISSLPYDDEAFDIAYLNFVLEHTCEPDRVLNEALRVLRPGGLLGMIVPVSDLPWMVPQSLRHRAGDSVFMLRYTLDRWVHLLRLRYVDSYFAFPLVEEPFSLVRPGSSFVPDDDQVYIGSTLELIKYLTHQRCEIVFREGRDIRSFVQSGRRPAIDMLRSLAFFFVRASLGAFGTESFTTTVTLVARKAA